MVTRDGQHWHPRTKQEDPSRQQCLPLGMHLGRRLTPLCGSPYDGTGHLTAYLTERGTRCTHVPRHTTDGYPSPSGQQSL